jgi:hypothetical protein
VGEFPGDALHGAELSVDANHADAVVVYEAGPELMAGSAAHPRAEPFVCGGHAARVYRTVYRH